MLKRNSMVAARIDASAVDAIMSLLTENGCTNVYIHRKAPKEANLVLPEEGVVQNHRNS
jgi:hypothetical protein